MVPNEDSVEDGAIGVTAIVVSVITPVYNCSEFIQECLGSIYSQKLVYNHHKIRIEISIFEDGSTDDTFQVMDNSLKRFGQKPDSFSTVVSRNTSGNPKGGYGRNRAIEQSSGEYLCFCDADDIMEPNRVITQYLSALGNHSAIVGSRFKRIPEDSTHNFTFWANNLTDSELNSQIFLSFGPSLVMPTWFCHKSVYTKVPGGFDETGRGTPEDLIFFYAHLDLGGQLLRTPELLMIYRYHPSATTFSVTDETIWRIRLNRLETKILSKWDKFSIWNAGKSGRRFYRGLKECYRTKVVAFCDIDAKKLKQRVYEPYPLKIKIPIIRPQEAEAPFIICVKAELIWDKEGPFRQLLDSLNLTEGTDFFYFN